MFEKYVGHWHKSLNGRKPTKDDINDFCNQYATSYEEYMTYWELMEDMFPEAMEE